MQDEVAFDRRNLHRRVAGGPKRLDRRQLAFQPTAIFTTSSSDPLTQTSTTVVPVTPTSSTPAITNPFSLPTNDPFTSLFGLPPPLTTSSSTTLSTTSTTLSTTSTSTTSTTPTTSATPTTTPPSTTPRTTAAQTSLGDVHVTVTTSLQASFTTAAAAATSAASNTNTTSTGTSPGVIIGGIVAAVIAVAGIIFAIVYFIRRSNHNEEDDAADFDPNAFRRQSTMLPGGDDDMSGMSRAMSYNHGARPPTMIEQKLANVPASYGTPPMPPYGGYGRGYEQGGFQPGQIVQPYSPATANSANPFFNAYGESPMGSPVSVTPYDSQYDAYGNVIARQPSNGSSAVLSRHTSGASKAVSEPPVDADGQYVDMARSSVTPFQAAQYVEISRQLNTAPPQALPPLSAVNEEAEYDHQYQAHAMQNPTQPLDLQAQQQVLFEASQHLGVPQSTPRESSFPESPFADPTMAAELAQYTPRRPSEESLPPMPPAPAFMAEQRERITSIPPTLPEIHLQERALSPVADDFPIAPSSVRPEPSPFAVSFDIPSPLPDAHFPTAPAPAAPAPAVRAQVGAAGAKRPDTVYTLYDDDDAYGGM